METIKPKKTLTEETYDILVDAICNGELTPGERLNQDDIAAKLNVSRQPVNSAISILKTNGLVADTGRRGVIVAGLDRSLFRSIFEYRRVVEPFAVRLACGRLPRTARTEADRILALGKEAVASGDLRAMVDADMQFHQAIYGWSRNDVIVSSMQVNWHHIRRAMAQVLRDSSLQRESWDTHARIADAMCAGQADLAAEMMEQHIVRAYEMMANELPANA